MATAVREPYPPIPYGMADFSMIRREGNLYVDALHPRAVQLRRDASALVPARRRVGAAGRVKALRKWGAALLLAATAPCATAQPDPEALRASVVQVVVLDGAGNVRRVRSGFAVSDAGHVATAAHGVANEDRIVVVPLATREELAARVVHANERADLALLAVDGLAQTPLPLAKNGFAAGRRVTSAGAWGEPGQTLLVAKATSDVPVALAEGAVGEHDELAATTNRPAVPLLLHNAMIPAAGYGGPVLNECGEVAGVNRGAPNVARWRLREGYAPETVVHGAAVGALAGLLLPAGIAFVQSDAECAEGRAAAEAKAAEAQAQAEAAAAEAGEAQAQAAASAELAEQKSAELQARQEALDAAETRMAELQTQYDEAVRTGSAEAETLQAELDGARTEREEAQAAVSAMEEQLAALRAEREAEAQANRQYLVTIAVVAVLLVAIIAIVVALVLRHRARELEAARQQAARAEQEAKQAQEEAERAQAEANAPPPNAPDCLLAGETASGQPLSIKLPGSLLAGEGAVIGRSPRNATFLIDDDTLSREHARMSVEADGGLQIEDLDSTNGTRLNGRQLKPRTPATVANDDVIELGGVKLRVAWEA